jgi:signal transduction histidine kinase
MVEKRRAKTLPTSSKFNLPGRTLPRRIERHLQHVKFELVQDLLEKEQLLTDEAWHTIAVTIPRFIPDWRPVQLIPSPDVHVLSFDPESKTLKLRGRGTKELTPKIFPIEDTVPGILVERNLQGETMDYLLIDPHNEEYQPRYRHYKAAGKPSSELVVALRHRGTICGAINIEHPHKNALSPLHVSIFLDAAAFISPFVYYILSEGERQRVREAASLYIQAKMLKRITSVYRHKMSQSIPLITFALHELEQQLKGNGDEANASLEEIRRLTLQLMDSGQDFLSNLPTVTSFHPIDIVATAKRAIGEFRHLQLPIDFIFHSDKDDEFLLASGLLLEHIYNLLQNSVHAISSAIQAGKVTHGSIFVTVERSDDVDASGVRSNGPRRVILRIKDNGIGIPPDLSARIFEYGFSTKRAQGGTGFGLAAARDYARSIGGDLVLENGLNGATFAMILQEYAPRFHDHLLVERLISPRRE